MPTPFEGIVLDEFLGYSQKNWWCKHLLNKGNSILALQDLCDTLLLALTLLNNVRRVFIGCDCGAFVCIMSYFFMSDCSPVFNQGDMEIMRRRMTLMIMTTSCSIIEDPTSTLIQTRQNQCDEHMRLHRTLRKTGVQTRHRVK